MPTTPSPTAMTSRPTPKRTRWTERASVILLLVTAAILAAAALPIVMRAAGLTRTSTTSRILWSRRDPQAALGSEDRARRPGFVFSNEDDEISDDDLDRLHRLHRSDDDLDNAPGVVPRGPDRDSEERAAGGDPAKHLEMGLARKELRLLDKPEGSSLLGELREGEVVMIMKQAGDWVLVVHSGSEQVVMGWVRRSEIAVR